MYHSIGQQLMRQDPAYYLWVHKVSTKRLTTNVITLFSQNLQGSIRRESRTALYMSLCVHTSIKILNYFAPRLDYRPLHQYQNVLNFESFNIYQIPTCNVTVSVSLHPAVYINQDLVKSHNTLTRNSTFDFHAQLTRARQGVPLHNQKNPHWKQTALLAKATKGHLHALGTPRLVQVRRGTWRGGWQGLRPLCWMTPLWPENSQHKLPE
ncbi:hypothetical protein CIRG_08814 [Coccidioides immitis RMSCC 2394]|uniref:Uncharacterized protein n=1 Tax=Coccidioides immitis RMSCC 2394 TaxID=404692 RepID=A0A0J6YQ95_COCIT|nr:hypothetical protein CIRG_08814 [Coccidioides immitis RMSCC 2394]